MKATPRSRHAVARRRGKALVLFALLLPVMVGGMALSIDTGIIGTARAQLRTVSDAAALAGAMQLVATEESLAKRLRPDADLSAEIKAARNRARQIGGSNPILSARPILNDNSSNSLDGDVVVGYLDTRTSDSALLNSLSQMALFNSVQVTARRTATQGGLVPTPFGSLLGSAGVELAVTSTATVRNRPIQGFESDGPNAQLLPIVLDLPTYQAMMDGTTTDQYTYDENSKTVHSGPDGVVESKLYPVKTGNPGNWGTIKVGVNNNSTKILGDQIRYGITPQQLATFPNGRITLSPATNPPSITFGGNPGISAGIKDDLAAIIGRPVSIPIYDQTGGNGNNAWYRVVAFAGVRIVAVNFQGNPKYVIVQPALIRDPTAIPDPDKEDLEWSQGGVVRLHLSR